jgi:hypothetical protein
LTRASSGRTLNHAELEEEGRDVKTTLLTVAVLMAIALLPSSASAATCSDYSTQADAQRAADTRDADGDGVYCVISPH